MYEVDPPQLESQCFYVDTMSKQFQRLSDKIVNKVCQDLDTYIQEVDKLIRGDNAPTDIQLDHIIMNLSSLLYFVSQAREEIGLKQDVCKAIYKEVYNEAHKNAKGTLADKSTSAELSSLTQEATLIIYNNAYASIKAREEAGERMLSAVKKVVSRRISELQLSLEAKV